MNDNLAILLLMVVAIAAAVTLTVRMAWIRQGSRREAAAVPGLAADQQVLSLSNENDELRRHVGRLEERLAAFERLATGPAAGTSREAETQR